MLACGSKNIVSKRITRVQELYYCASFCGLKINTFVIIMNCFVYIRLNPTNMEFIAFPFNLAIV